MICQTGIPQHNSNQGSEQYKHDLSKIEEKHGIIASYTFTFEDGQKMKSSTAKMDYITEIMVMSAVKLAINLFNSNTVKISALGNLEDSSLKMLGKFTARMTILSARLESW